MTDALVERSFLVHGLGITGRAVARSLRSRDLRVVLADDAPGDAARALADELDLPIAGGAGAIDAVGQVDAVVPAPGLPDAHPVMRTARAEGVAILSEFDLAGAWDDRPMAAVTGTNGKTTVTELVTDMLDRSGIAAASAGNTDVPLVEAIDDPATEWFVVEASSFRLGHSRRFAPKVAAWLNFAPDHLDVHESLATYESAKAAIWRDQSGADVAVANRDDPVVWAHASGPARVVPFGVGAPVGGAFGVVEASLVDDEGDVIVGVDELSRSAPHDIANALAAAAVARNAGATRGAVHDALVAFRGLAHRVELVAERDGVRWFDDSKATVPHAVGAAVRGFRSVVLIAGGRNKGLDLSVLGGFAPPVRAVVGIGESGADVVAAFGDLPHRVATSMDEAVVVAAELAEDGDVVVLSPGCASFDWYAGYAARGDDFVRAVRRTVLSDREVGS